MADDSSFSINGPSTLRGAVILLIVGLLATGFGAYDYVQQSDAVANSVEVDAEITEIGVESVSSGSSSGASYKPTVQFTYEFEGTSYTGTNVFPAEISSNYDTESAARAVLEDYEAGDTVTAYVVSNDPSKAFLKNKTSNTPLLFVGIGLLFVLLGGASSVKHYQ